MITADAFTDEITRRPDALEPRLIYADWLEGQDDPRGTFIRLQIERSRLPARDSRSIRLRVQERELLVNHGRRWLGPCAPLVSGWRFRRGFVEGVTLEAGVFLHNAARLFRHWPLRHVRLIGVGRYLPTLALCPQLARLESLDLSCNALDVSAMATLGSSPNLRRLRRLDLSNNHVGDQGLRVLARCRGLAHLSRLSLRENGIGDRGLEMLASAPHLTRLKRLDLADNQIDDLGATALAASENLATLRVLDLSDNQIGGPGVAALLASPQLRRLRTLELRGNRS